MVQFMGWMASEERKETSTTKWIYFKDEDIKYFLKSFDMTDRSRLQSKRKIRGSRSLRDFSI